MNTIFITGVAGFIGSSLADRLRADGKSVVGWDNLSTGQEQFLEGARKHPNFKFVQGDNLDLNRAASRKQIPISHRGTLHHSQRGDHRRGSRRW